MKQCGIYGFRNTANGKWYIGQSVDLEFRRQIHLSSLRHGRHFNLHLQKAFNKYGESLFEFRILEICSENMLDMKESAWITHYNSLHALWGYNAETGGSIGKHHSPETIAKMSQAKIGNKYCVGRHHSEQSKEKMSQAKRGQPNKRKGIKTGWSPMTGQHHSEITRLKISTAMLGKGHPHSNATRLKLSNAWTHRKRTQSRGKHGRYVKQLREP